MIAATAHGSGIRHEGITLDSFDADIDFDSHPEHESKIDAHLRKLIYDERTFDTGRLHACWEAGQLCRASRSQSARARGDGPRRPGPFAQGVFRGQLNGLTIKGAGAAAGSSSNDRSGS